MSESDDVVNFEAAKKRIEAVNQEEKEKDLEKRFKKAMGWKIKRKAKGKTKVKKESVSPISTGKGPRGKGRRR